MLKVLPRLTLHAADREEIERWVRAHGTPQQVMLRSHIVLAAADGQSDSAIAQALAVNRKTVTLWRARYATEGLECRPSGPGGAVTVARSRARTSDTTAESPRTSR